MREAFICSFTRDYHLFLDRQIRESPDQRHFVAMFSAEQLIDRHAKSFALDVVESEVDAGDQPTPPDVVLQQGHEP